MRTSLPPKARTAGHLLAALLLAGSGGCYKVASDANLSEYKPYTGQAPLTVRGVRPGQTESDVVALLGPPDRRGDSGYRIVSLQWQRFPDMVVTLDGTGQVTEVLGDRLTAGDDEVVSHGMSEADVRQVLGKPAKSQSHYRPSGSGVISLGRTRTGGTLSYRRDEQTIEINLLENGVGYVRLLGIGVRS